MIKFVVIQNKQGKVRLAKWYVTYDDDEKREMIREVHRIVNSRSSKFTNFVEFRKDLKVVYRRYAALYITVCVDNDENDLSILELIHLFVEVLDEYFGNVCELDVVFNFHKVCAVLDEIIGGGEVMETHKGKILKRIAELDSLE